MTGAPVLGTRNLKKVYSGRAVVDDVSIEVHPGEIVGLLGPNGAGKTTTFYMVVGLTQPDSGKPQRPMTVADRVMLVGDGFDTEILLQAPDVAAWLGVNQKRVYELPIRRVRLSRRCIRWRPSDVEAFIDQRAESV